MTNQLPPHSTRRTFLKRAGAASAITIVGSGLVRPMTAWAVPGTGNDTVLVNLFLRGGADGLNIVVPHGDPEYYARRPTLGVPATGYTDLDGFFGLNNHFSSLLPQFQQGRLAVVHAAGSQDDTRSHFSAQPKMDTAFEADGWLQRALGVGNFDQGQAGLSIGDRVSPSLQGPWSGAVVDRISTTVRNGMSLAVARTAIEEMYETTRFSLEETAVASALQTIDQVSTITPGDPGAYPSNHLGRDFSEAAALIKADFGVRGVAIDYGGWDTHDDQAPRFENLGPILSNALAAFQTDLGATASRVIIVVMTEFGRTARENGSGGTDHGHGNLMLVMGEPLVDNGGGQVLLTGEWPGLSPTQLNEDRDLVVTTDFRSVLAELLEGHLAVDPGPVFPGFTPNYVGLLEPGCRSAGFVDVPFGQYFTEPVDWAACAGITTGTSATTFAPAGTVTRAQLATFMWRMAGEPTGFTHPFTDVASPSYYEDAVAWMAANEITTGTTATTFSPNDPVTRGQMATFLWRYDGEPTGFTHPFTDVASPSYYEDAVAWMAANEITTGTTTTTFSPANSLTRAQAVTFLYRYDSQP